MTWMVPSAVSVLVSAATLAVVYWYLASVYRERYLRFWAWSWTIYAVRFAFLLAEVGTGRRTIYTLGYMGCSVVSAVVLISGTRLFAGKEISRLWIGLGAAGLAWIVGAVGVGVSPPVLALPVFLLLSFADFQMATSLLQSSPKPRSPVLVVTAAIYVLWGIHKLDYPVLRFVPWFAPVGYLIGAFFGLVTGIGILLVFFDKVRASLAKSEARLRLAQEAVGVGTWEWNLATDENVWSDELWTLFALAPGSRKASYEAWRRCVHEDDRAKAERAVRTATRDGVGFSLEWRVNAGGEPRWLLSRGVPIRDASGEVSRYVGIVIDITERRRAEEALRLSEDKYRRLFEDAAIGVFRSTLDDHFLEVNPALARMLGFASPQEVIDSIHSISRQIYVDPPQRTEVIDEALAKGGVVKAENRYRRKDGAVWIGNLILRSVKDANGQPQYFEGFVEDITERKRSEEERTALEAQLLQAQKMEAIGTLAGGIAHDFNNILTPIMAHGELALMQLPEGDPVRDDIAGLLAATERAATLVKQILAVSRKEDRGAPVPVNLGALVKELATFLRASIPSTIELRVEVDPTCGPVLAEPSRLHQVLLNLCTNASYAMAETGGALTVSLEREQPSGGSQRVRLAVSDTGPGIPADVQGRIFEPYFTTKPVGKGSGLGLAVVHGIVTSLGGEIRVRSKPGAGATFEVLLPESEPEGAPRRPSAEPLPRGAGQHVLAVDDEPAIRSMLKRMLTTLGYEATVCGSGAEALEVFRADPRRVDVVLTDHTMPGMTGMALAAELRALRPELPIVLSTGFSEGVDEKAVAASGLRGPVMKPYSAQAVAEALRAALHEHRVSPSS